MGPCSMPGVYFNRKRKYFFPGKFWIIFGSILHMYRYTIIRMQRKISWTLARVLFNYFGFKINPKMNFSVLSHGSSKQMYEKIDRRTVYPTTPSSNITLNIIEITYMYISIQFKRKEKIIVIAINTYWSSNC